MKRAIAIIIIILIVVALFLTGAWLLSRHTAKKNSSAPMSFKQFLTGKNTVTNPSNPDGDLSSVFVDDNLNNTDQTTPDTSTTPGTNTSVFTNGTTTPDSSNNGGSTIGGNGTQNGNGQNGGGTSSGGPTSGGSGSTGGGQTTTTTTTGTGNGQTTTTTTSDTDPTTQTPTQVPPIVAGPECTDADLNIQFTPQQLAELQVLQNRFYAVAQSIHSDADVATELGNHDNFATKVQKVEELYNYCVAKAPAISNPWYKKRIPTPFWHADPNLPLGFGSTNSDSQLYIASDGDYDGGNLNAPLPCGIIGPCNGSNSNTNTDDPLLNVASNITFGQRTLERSLRINLW